MDKFGALAAFVEVAEAGGFSSAARRLNLATSSVMRSVDTLEASLGTALLNRTTRHVTLSDAGTHYYLRAKKLLDDMADADASVSDRGDEASGPLRVSIPVAFGWRCISPYIGLFLAQYPKIELDLVLSDSIADLVTERIDLAIRLGEAASTTDAISRSLGSFQRFVVASAEYLATHGNPNTPDELSGHHCLRFSYGPEQQLWTFCRGSDVIKIAVTGRFKTNNSEVLREAVLNGAGIAVLPSWLVLQDIQAGKLTKLFEDFDVTPNNVRSVVSAIYLPTQRGSKRVNAFIDFVIRFANPLV